MGLSYVDSCHSGLLYLLTCYSAFYILVLCCLHTHIVTIDHSSLAHVFSVFQAMNMSTWEFSSLYVKPCSHNQSPRSPNDYTCACVLLCIIATTVSRFILAIHSSLLFYFMTAQIWKWELVGNHSYIIQVEV